MRDRRVVPTRQIECEIVENNALDIGETICAAVASSALIGDSDRLVGSIHRVFKETADISDGVDTAATVKGIIPAAANEQIVAAAAAQGVGGVVAGQFIGEARPVHAFKPNENVAFGVAARRRAVRERDRNAVPGPNVGENILAGAPRQAVCAAAAFNDVFAIIADKPIVAVTADQIFDVG